MLKIEVVSDVICPWCFIGKRRLEQAIGRFDEEVSIRWLPLQLNPTMPSGGMDLRVSLGQIGELGAVSCLR